MDDAPKKIVIVEDNPALGDIYKSRLEMLGYEVHVATDGIAGLYTIQNEAPDLVLLDLMVPAIAGDEVLRKMRGVEWGKDIPVLVMSNLNEEDAPSGLRELGIVDYVVKANLEHSQLDDIVNGILHPEKNK